MASLLGLVVTLVSCGFTQPIYEDGEYSGRRSSSRIYDDPYYTNNSRTTIVRDPYTGQYYEVTPVGPGGNYSGANAYPYGNAYPSRRSGYSSRNSNDRSYSRGSSTSNRNTTSNTPARRETQQPSNNTNNSSSKKISEAREKMNGSSD